MCVYVLVGPGLAWPQWLDQYILYSFGFCIKSNSYSKKEAEKNAERKQFQFIIMKSQNKSKSNKDCAASVREGESQTKKQKINMGASQSNQGIIGFCKAYLIWQQRRLSCLLLG